MSRISSFALGFAVPLTLVSNAAMADLTPAQVWDDWRDYMQNFGYVIEAQETANGANLDVSDVKLSFIAPQGASTVEMNIGSIGFEQNSDGSVAIILPDEMPVTMAVRDSGPGKQNIDMQMTIVHEGHDMTVSGEPDAMVYEYAADSMTMNIGQEIGNAQQLSKDTATMQFVGTGVSNTTKITKGETRAYDQTSTIASATYTLNVSAPGDDNQSADISGSLQGITAGGTGSIPLTTTDMTDMQAMIAAGFDVTADIAYQSGSSNFDVKNDTDGSFKMQTTSAGGNLDVAIGAGGLAYAGGQKDLKLALVAAAMPLPIELAMAETGFNLSMPMAKSEEPQDFAFGFTMGDFTMSDLIWGLFDPQAQLPRDPATVTLDLAGKAKILADLLNPQNVTNINGPQADLVQLKLNNLLIDAVGAKLEGDGDVSFDGSGPSLIPNVGTPVGTINMALAGGNGLLDKLTGMGLLPQEQALGARMMMGIFAVPGVGEDTLKSSIEFTQDGQITANGQRIR